MDTKILQRLSQSVAYRAGNKTNMNSSDIIDLNTINQLKEILEDELEELFIEFKSNTLELITELKKEQKTNNHDAIINLAHTIKGSSGNLGLTKVYEASKQLETGLRDNSILDINLQINNIEAAYIEVISELKARNLLTQ